MFTLFKITEGRKLGLFQRIFITLMAVIVLPVLVVLAINYNIYISNLENEVGKSNLDTLRQTKEATDNILQLTDNLSLQILRNNNVLKFVKDKQNLAVYKDIEVITNAIKSTGAYLEGTQYIHSMFLYSATNNRLISDIGNTNSFSVKDMNNLSKMAGGSSGTLWIEPNESGVFNENYNGIQLVKFIYRNFSELEGFILIQLKNDNFINLIHELNIRNSGYIIISNREGKVIMSRDKGIGRIDSLNIDKAWLDGPEGFRNINNRGINLLVSFTTSRYNDWKYIAVLPLREIENKFSLIKNITILVFALFTVIAVFISLAMTRGIYNPINLIYNILKGEKPDENQRSKLLMRKDEFGEINKQINEIVAKLDTEKHLRDDITNENTELKQQQIQNTDRLNNYFLYRIISGDISDRDELVSQAEFFNIPVQGTYLVVIVNINKKFYGVSSLYSDEERIVIRRRVLYTLEVSVSRIAAITAFYESDDRIIGIINLDNIKSEDQAVISVKGKCEDFQTSVLTDLGFSVSVSIGNSYRGLENIKASHKDAVQALKYKFILGTDVVILNQDLKRPEAVNAIRYDYRKFLLNSLNAQNVEETLRVIDDFKEHLKNSSIDPQENIYYYKDVINILIQYLHEIKFVDDEELKELKNIFLNFETRFENIDEATDWIGNFVRNIFVFLNRNNDQAMNKLVTEVLLMIEKEYDKDLSLADLADRLGVSMQYLSKIFKDDLNKNFKEYLTEYKIQKAKDLLKETDLKIYEIAARVGYNNSLQFTRMFKKYEHITPIEFREM